MPLISGEKQGEKKEHEKSRFLLIAIRDFRFCLSFFHYLPALSGRGIIFKIFETYGFTSVLCGPYKCTTIRFKFRHKLYRLVLNKSNGYV